MSSLDMEFIVNQWSRSPTAGGDSLKMNTVGVQIPP